MECGYSMRSLLPVLPARFCLEQRLLPGNPLRDCLINPSVPYSILLTVGSWRRLLPCLGQACKAFSPYLGQITPQYLCPSCLVLCNLFALAMQYIGYTCCHHAIARDEPRITLELLASSYSLSALGNFT